MPAGGDHRAVLQALIERVDRGRLVERALADFQRRIRGYSLLSDPVLHGQILEVVGRNFELCFAWVGRGEEPSEEDFAPFRESAKNRAAEGLPLEDVLKAYRIGAQIGWQTLSEIARDDERESLLYATEMILDYIDRVSSTVAQAYFEERQHLVSEEERDLRELLDAIASGAEIDAPLHAVAERAGFPIAGRYRPFAIAAPGGHARDHARIAAALRARGRLALTEGDRVVGLEAERADGARPPDDGELLVAGPQTGGDGAASRGGELVVVGAPLDRGELADGLHDVRLGADIGRRLGRAGVLPVHLLALELLLARSPRIARELQRRVLGPLGSAGERLNLVHTIEVYLGASIDRRAAAARLHIHPNTLDYRLRRAGELTGLDLHRPDDLALLVLAFSGRTPGAGDSAGEPDVSARGD